MDRELIGTGRLADVYAWDDGLALKLYRDPARNDSARREAEATMLVNAAGVPAVRCHGTAEINGRVGLILDRLPGPLMADIVFERGDQAMMELADLQARIHDCTAKGFRSLKELLAPRIKRALPARLHEPVLRRLRELPDGDSVLHSDLHVLNVMQDRIGSWVAIDWDIAITGPHHYGVARTVFLGAEADPGELEATPELASIRRHLVEVYLAQYAALRTLNRDELAAWRLPVLANRLNEEIQAERDYLLAAIEEELS